MLHHTPVTAKSVITLIVHIWESGRTFVKACLTATQTFSHRSWTLTHCLAYLTHRLVEAKGNVSIREPSIALASGIYRACIDRATVVQHHTLLTHLDIPFVQYIFIVWDSVPHSHFILAHADHRMIAWSSALSPCHHCPACHHQWCCTLAHIVVIAIVTNVTCPHCIEYHLLLVVVNNWPCIYSKHQPLLWSLSDHLTITCIWLHLCL